MWDRRGGRARVVLDLCRDSTTHVIGLRPADSSLLCVSLSWKSVKQETDLDDAKTLVYWAYAILVLESSSANSWQSKKTRKGRDNGNGAGLE